MDVDSNVCYFSSEYYIYLGQDVLLFFFFVVFHHLQFLWLTSIFLCMEASSHFMITVFLVNLAFWTSFWTLHSSCALLVFKLFLLTNWQVLLLFFWGVGPKLSCWSVNHIQALLCNISLWHLLACIVLVKPLSSSSYTAFYLCKCMQVNCWCSIYLKHKKNTIYFN